MAEGSAFLEKLRVNLRKLQEEAQREGASTTRRRKPIFLVLGGSFYPIHRRHVGMFHEARDRLREQANVEVVGGFLAVTSDEWIEGKLMERGMSEAKIKRQMIRFPRRLELAHAATSDSDLVTAFPYPQPSANALMRAVTRETQVEGYMLCGADLLIKGAYLYCPVVVFPRTGMEADLARALTTRMEQRGGTAIVLEELGAEADAGADWFTAADLSSTQCRESMAKGEWARLVADGMLHPAVAALLERWSKERAA